MMINCAIKFYQTAQYIGTDSLVMNLEHVGWMKGITRYTSQGILVMHYALTFFQIAHICTDQTTAHELRACWLDEGDI